MTLINISIIYTQKKYIPIYNQINGIPVTRYKSKILLS